MRWTVVIFAITAAIIVMSSVLFVLVSAGAKQAQTLALAESTNQSLNSPVVRQGLFALGIPTYGEVSCSDSFTHPASIPVTMSYQTPPRSCSVFVNEKLLYTQTRLRPQCTTLCPYEDFTISLSVEGLDVRDPQNIRVCCNTLCHERTLAPVC